MLFYFSFTREIFEDIWFQFRSYQICSLHISSHFRLEKKNYQLLLCVLVTVGLPTFTPKVLRSLKFNPIYPYGDARWCSKN